MLGTWLGAKKIRTTTRDCLPTCIYKTPGSPLNLAYTYIGTDKVIFCLKILYLHLIKNTNEEVYVAIIS